MARTKLTDDSLCEAIKTDTYIKVKDLKEIKKQPNIQELYLKLNKYEKLDITLGCPLEVLIKAKQGFFTKKGFISPEHIYTIDLLNETIDFEYWQAIDDGVWNDDGFWDEEGQVYIEDYKKTWWLKEDRSE